MLTVMLVLVLGICGLFRVRNRAGVSGLMWKMMNKGADVQEATLRKRWLIPVLAVLGATLLVAGHYYTTWTKCLSLVGLLAMLLAFFILWDWSFTWGEQRLGQLVRSQETRRYSLVVLAISFLLFLAVLLFPARDAWAKIADGISLAVFFGGGLWAAVRSVRHSIFDTFPGRGEELASFAIAVLQTILHHFATAVLLTWGSLGYLNKLFPGSFVDQQDVSAGFWLLGNYAVGKLTVSGSSLVKPTAGLGGFADTVFSVLGAGFIVLAVTSLFAVLSRARPDTKPRK